MVAEVLSWVLNKESYLPAASDNGSAPAIRLNANKSVVVEGVGFEPT